MGLLRPLAVLLALGFAGCTQCERACRAQALAYDDCLRDWGQEWRDLGADDVEGYRDLCIVTWDTHLASLGDDDRAAESAQCADLADDLTAASTCEESQAALQNYGVLD